MLGLVQALPLRKFLEILVLQLLEYGQVSIEVWLCNLIEMLEETNQEKRESKKLRKLTEILRKNFSWDTEINGESNK